MISRELTPREKIAVIEINGPITHTGGFDLFGGRRASAEEIIPLIERVRESSQFKALVLKIDTPGGSAAGSQAIYKELMRLKEETNKPIIATLGDSATSGGYYIASAAHWIMAYPATLTGSIGVILEIGNYQGLYEKLGIEFQVFKGGDFKDLGHHGRSLTQEEMVILQTLTQDIYEQFIDDVVKGRGMGEEKIRELATGEIFSGSQAYQLQLVDELGTYYDAIEQATKMATLKDPTVENLSRTSYGLWYSFLDLLSHLGHHQTLFPFLQDLKPFDTIKVLF